MQKAAIAAPSPKAVLAAGLVTTAAWVVAVLVLMAGTTYDIWAAPLIAPILFAVTLPILIREAKRTGDRKLLWILIGAVAIKLLGALVRFYGTFVIYDGGDAGTYHFEGIEVARALRAGYLDGGLESLTGTFFITYATGVLYALIGPTLLGGFLFFSWLSFWGFFFFYKAFALAVPEGSKRMYAGLIFFLPSILYWPSSIGKEAWMTLALGVGSYGCAMVMKHRTLRGLLLVALGIWAAGVVRIPVAGMLGVALAGAYLLRKPRPELRQLAPIAKLISVAVLVAFAVFLIGKTEDFLQVDDIASEGLFSSSGIETALQNTAARSDYGGSEFEPAIVTSPIKFPMAAVTVLFRPFPHEAGNIQAILTALEGTALMLLTLIRWRWILAALKSVRRQPYVAFAVLFVVMFVVGFSSFPNFGLLVRQRVQVLPFLLVLLCIPPLRGRGERDDRA